MPSHAGWHISCCRSHKGEELQFACSYQIATQDPHRARVALTRPVVPLCGPVTHKNRHKIQSVDNTTRSTVHNWDSHTRTMFSITISETSWHHSQALPPLDPTAPKDFQKACQWKKFERLGAYLLSGPLKWHEGAFNDTTDRRKVLRLISQTPAQQTYSMMACLMATGHSIFYW